MIPIAGRPIVEHVVRSLTTNGVGELLVVVGHKREVLQDFLGDGGKFEAKISYKVQPGVLGTADAVGMAEEFVGEEDFLVIYGDLFTKPRAIHRVLETYEASGKKPTLTVVSVPNPSSYGVVSVSEDKATRIVEKPEPQEVSGNLANAGIYIFGNEIFDAIRSTVKSERGELEVTDSVNTLIGKGIEFAVVRIEQKDWVDMGCPWDVLEANRLCLTALEPRILGEIESGARLVGPVFIDREARILSGAYVEGPAYIGENCEIGPNCLVRPYTSLGKEVKIGNACEVKNSIVMDATKIPHNSYIGDSIIGENCNFGAGTIVANLRLDYESVKMMVKGKLVDSETKKLGVIVGDNVRTGVNVSLMPGIKIGGHTWIGPNVLVYRDLPSGVIVTQKQELEQREIRR
jgi:bifunctional UDP-N-acetylglucosamine pyrophosphorylase/glucosamine-1-phosphate N-acetyltransferase